MTSYTTTREYAWRGVSLRGRLPILFSLLVLFGFVAISNTPRAIEQHATTSDYVLENKEQVVIQGERLYAPSSEGDDYVDSVQSVTHGTNTTGPPNGMGADDSSHTTLTETSTTTYSWNTLQTQSTFNGLPSGWTDQNIAYPLDDYFHEDGSLSGEIYSSAVNTANAVEVRFILNIECTFESQDGMVVSFWNGTTWNSVGDIVEASEGDQTFTSSSSQYFHSGFRVRVSYVSLMLTIDFKANNWRVQKRVPDNHYAFQAVYKFTGVDYGTYYSEELVVDFSEESSEDTLEFRFASGDTTPNNLVKDSANGSEDFSVDIHSYLTGSECYLEIRDEHRSGDLVSTNWTIDRLYINLTNTQPVSDTDPVTAGLVNSNDVLAQYNYITSTINVSDADGFSHIDYVTLSIYDDARSTSYFTLQFNESDDSFFEATHNDRVTLDVGSSSSSKSNDAIDLILNFTITFDCPAIASVDYHIEVYDVDGASDDLWYEADWDAVTTLALDGALTLDDGSGTPSRGNTDGSITATGTIIYSGATSYHPQEGLVSIELSCVNVTGSPWSVSVYNDGDGTFSRIINADDEIGVDTYSIEVSVGGSDRLDGVYDATYISDQIVCASLSSPSFIVDSSATGQMEVRLQYVYDGSDVVDGTYELNGIPMIYQSGDLWIASHTPNALTSITYDTVTIESINTHGIDILDMNGTSVTMFWDQLVCYISDPTQSLLTPGTNASGIVIWAEYYYASLHPLYIRYDGTLHVNDSVFVLESPGRKGYNVSSADGDDTWGITTIFSSNSTFCVWEYPGDPPSWLEIPGDQESEYFISFVYNINATSSSGLDLWWVNDTIHFSVDLNGVVSNASVLDIGVYPVKVFVNDTWGRPINATFLVTVEDTIGPIWVDAPSIIPTEFGDYASFDVNASDPSGISSWWLNNTVQFDIDANGTVTSKFTLPVGSYGLRIFVNDSRDNRVNTTLTVIYQDSTPPSWVVAPNDQLLEVGDALDTQFVAFDLSSVSRWAVNNSDFAITTNGQLSNATILQAGSYSLLIEAFDEYDNVINATIVVTVQDTTAPIWISFEENHIVELGVSFYYNLEATDLSGIASWWVDDSRFAVDSSGIIISTVSLVVGEYSLDVGVSDPYENSLNGTLSILVRDTTAPSWVNIPQDQTILQGSPFSYQLAATDLSAIASWSVNDTEHFAIDSTGLLTDVDTLDVGTYHVEIAVTDEYDNALSVVLTITVRPTFDPALFTVLAVVGIGISSTMLLIVLRMKKTVEKGSVQSGEGKEDLSTALDYLDQIQEEQKPEEDSGE
jgi:hypothetical protein